MFYLLLLFYYSEYILILPKWTCIIYKIACYDIYTNKKFDKLKYTYICKLLNQMETIFPDIIKKKIMNNIDSEIKQ